MKKIVKRTLIITSVLCLSLFALTACNNTDNTSKSTDNNGGTSTSDTTKEAQTYADINTTIKTSDDYIAALETFTSAAGNVKTDLADRLSKIDTTDTAAVKEVTDLVKKPFTQFLSVTAPSSYSAVNKSYQEACNEIIDYIDQTAAGKDASATLTKAQKTISDANNTLANSIAATAKNSSDTSNAQ